MNKYELPAWVKWPKEWRNVPLWAMFERIKDVGHPGEEMLSVYREYGVIKKSSRNDNTNQTAENRDIYQLIDEGWLVVNRMKAWQGSVGISPLRGIVSGHYICFRPRNGEDPRFLNWLLRSGIYAVEYSRMSRGVRPGQIEIDNDELHGLRIALPPLGEQRRIADFLDIETARIDQLTVLQQMVRASVEARTKARLDLKIDKLTDTYGTLPFRRMIRSVEQGVSPQCDNFPAGPKAWGVLKVSAVKNGVFSAEENKQLPADIQPERRYEIKSGDLLITRANTPELVGAAAVANSPRPKIILCDKIFRIVTTRDLLPEFLVLVSLGTRIRVMCAEASHGTSQSMANLKTEEIKRWPIPAIPIPIQRAVIAELATAREHAANLIEKIDRQLALLAERRQTLITAAVAGQIDVTTARDGVAV
jgi:type I restriction enzyme, S subunit